MSVSIITGDCRDVLKTLPDASVQCCVTSPPYDNLRDYGGYAWDLLTVAAQLFRVLCDGGVLCWNVGDQVVDGSETLTSMRHALHFVDVAGFRMHDTMIYEKVNFSRPEHVRYHQMFEYVFILSKGQPRTFNPIRDKPNVYAGRGTFGANTMRQADGTMKERERNVIAEFGMRGNVWRGKTSGQESVCSAQEHPATMPQWLAADLIASWSNEGDTVIDPFAGSGTTGVAADRQHRNAILIEVHPPYVDLAKRKITADSPLFTEVTTDTSAERAA